MNRSEQALRGLEIDRADGVVVVDDGQTRWVCLEDAFDEVCQHLADLDALPGWEGDAEAYAELCQSIYGPVVASHGQDEGSEAECRELVARAFAAGLLDEGEHLVQKWLQ